MEVNISPYFSCYDNGMLRQSLSSCEHIATYHILFSSFTSLYILLLYIIVLLLTIHSQTCDVDPVVYFLRVRALDHQQYVRLGYGYNRYGIAFDFVSRLWYKTGDVDGSYCIMANTLDNRHRFVVIITRKSIAYDIALDPVRG